MAGESHDLDIDAIKAYAANSSRVGGALAALFKHDGWKIFIALYRRKKKEIEAKSDYESLDAFKGDRKALEIIEDLFEEMEGFVEESADAAKALEGISTEPAKERGIMLIEGMEGREG